MSKTFLLLTTIGALVAGLTWFPLEPAAPSFHTKAELEQFKNMDLVNPPPVDSSLLFPHSSACGGCHGFDPTGNANVDLDGNDVNVFDDWRTTMMANSAKDPFWRAKISHEIHEIPNFSDAIQTKCTSCHAPQGHYTALSRGATHYTLADLLVDTIGLDGVSCGACHQTSLENLGEQFSGNMTFDTNRVVYGPYEIPFAAPMISFVGFEPLFSEHISDAGICASCHTLVTDAFDLEGEPTGTTFVEQATYHEWLNSTYDPDNVSCQSCHMPQIDDPVVISSNYLFLEGRSPYGLHDLVGANTFMLELMRNNKEVLDIDATNDHFDETIAKTLAMLQEQSLNVDLELAEVYDDTAYFSFYVQNKAGHKFPSGYPSRRAWLEFIAVNEEGDTIFHSGKVLPDHSIAGHDDEFEPHYQSINQEDQVQIYEMVPGDVNGNFTTVLEFGYTHLKDNRLTPIGFSTSHPVYDTTKIVGLAETDPDFNFDVNGMEGSGSDRTEYRIALDDYIGELDVFVHVHYQSLPPRWLAPMFELSTPEIDAFRTMYDSEEPAPVLVKSISLEDVFVEGGAISTTKEVLASDRVRLFPNPSADGWMQIRVPATVTIEQVRLLDLQGRELQRWRNPNQPSFQVNQTGFFLVEITTDYGVVVKKWIVE